MSVVHHQKKIITSAIDAWRSLSGICCIYKPAGITLGHLKKTVLGNIFEDINKLKVRPPDPMVQISGATNKPMLVELSENLADHTLVVGPRYQFKDMRSGFSKTLGIESSGVILMGINDTYNTVSRLNIARLTRAFKVHGTLGKATDSYFSNGKVVEKATFRHITRSRIDHVVSYIQSMHQQKMLDLCGLDMNSQAAYELAIQGPMRPVDKNIPVLYGIKCVHFESPNFIIEVQSINEYEKYLHTLIHDIGIQLKSVAHCTAVQCIRHGRFTLDDALLRKHWRLNHILDSIENCHNKLITHKELLKPISPTLM